MAIALALLAVSCSSGDTEPETAQTASTQFVAKPTISLVVNDWTASAINVAVAEILIERHLGYPVVPEVVYNSDDMYSGLAGGTYDAVLEIWPSNMSERDQQYFDRSQVLNLGPLGPVGKVGWFVPSYVIETRPELASWEGFQSSDVAAQFATVETDPRGRFLGTTADYQQFDGEIINNLGLPFEVVFSGSEDATLAELDAAVQAREPLLLYWWTPTAAAAAYDLVNVSLPEPTPECRAAANLGDAAAVDCDYPDDELFKAGSPALADKAPPVAQFLEAFTLTTEDQLQLLVAVEIDGVTIDAAAEEWIEGNEPTWRAWLDEPPTG